MAVEGNGLLAHLTLSGWFTNSIEPIATQSLAYFLARSASARRAVQETVLAGGADVGTLESVWPEAVGQDGGIPDVACFDGDGTVRVLIENKFWANLTQHQPETYLSRLQKEGKPSALLFVAPEARIPLLWSEVCEREGMTAALDADAGATLKSVVARDKIYMIATSWRQLLDKMARSPDEALLGDIRQLQVLCEKMEEDTLPWPLPPDLEAVTPWLTRLIDDATDSARSKGYLNTQGLHRTPQPHGYGRYVEIGIDGKPGGGTAWFGINSILWTKYGQSPLWVMFVSNADQAVLEKVRRSLASLEVDGYEQQSRSLWPGPNVPVPLPVDIDGYEARRGAVVERMREIAALLSDTA